MATFNNGDSGSSVRTKINNVLQHADGTAGELVINENGGDVDFRVESDTLTNALFVDGATGNVGLGTGTPGVKLDVSGAGRFSTRVTSPEFYGSTTGITQYMDSLGTTGMYVTGAGASPSNSIRFYSAGTNVAIFDSGGNMGIGTSSPAGAFSAKLAVIGGDIALSDGAKLKVIGAGYTNSLELYNSSTGGMNLSVAFPTASFTVATNSQERMRINAAGDVGIGTTNPAQKLVISATTEATANFINSVSYGSAILLSSGAAGGKIWGLQSTANGDGTVGGGYFVITNQSDGTVPFRMSAAGNLGLGVTPNAASILDAQSTTKGVRFPNMTTTQKNLIANVAGNVIFDTTLGKLCVNTGSGWQTITSA